MGRRHDTVRAGVGLAFAALIAVGVVACGGGNADPYAVIDQARTASYERIQVNIGFDLEVPPPQLDIPDMPNIDMPGTSMHVDATWITAAADVPAGRYYLRLAVPVEALGPAGQLGLPVGSIELEALTDGTDLYVKSPLLPMALQGGFGNVVKGDLTGWVRVTGAGALGPMAPAMLGFPFLGSGELPALPALPLPSPGAVAELRSLLTEMGATIEYAGTESVQGAELIHLKGGLRIATLAASRPFLAMTGMTREQVQSLVALEGQVGISTDIWFNKATGRLATLRIDGTNAETPATTVAVILRIADPGADITFQPPATFTDIDLSGLMGGPFVPGFDNEGGGGVDGGGVVGTVEPVPQQTEAPATP